MTVNIQVSLLPANEILLIKWGDATQDQKKSWKILTSEAIHDPFIGGDWFKSAYIDPDKLTNKPILFFIKEELIGFMTPRFEGKENTDGAPTSGKWRSGVIYLMKKHRGKGYMLRILFQFFSEHYPAQAWIDDKNISSKKLYLKLGFKKYREEDFNDKEKGAWYVLSGKPKPLKEKGDFVARWVNR